MAGSLNRATIIGNLGRDPETRHTQAGQMVVNFTLATTESWKDKSGERQERTEWHRVVIFNEGLAKVAESYLRKGSKCLIEGKLQTRKWTDKDDIERYTTEIVVTNFDGRLILLDGKGNGERSVLDESGGGGGGSSRGSGRSSGRGSGGGRTTTGAGYRTPSDLDDEIPFAPEWRA